MAKAYFFTPRMYLSLVGFAFGWAWHVYETATLFFRVRNMRAFRALLLKKNNSMIEYIKGELTELTPALAVVETAGVGYALSISLNTYSDIQGKKVAKLYVHEAIQTGGRDDNYTLYGFATKRERELYRLLITVSGVGANTARTMLSSLSPQELCNAIANGDEKLIKTVKGIGLKTAQRVIVDLRDKIMSTGIADELHVGKGTSASSAINTPVYEEAVSAMTMLGFSPAPTAKVVTEIIKEHPDWTVETVVKETLKRVK